MSMSGKKMFSSRGQRVFLTGFMGVGKSTLGLILAQHLGSPFVDLDLEIEKRLGLKVPEIFQTYGEGFFRERESEVLYQILQEYPQGVIALGGGVFLNPSHRRVLNAQGISVYLKASVDTLCLRLLGEKWEQRPLLKGLDGQSLKSRIESLLHEREPAYGEACLCIVTDDQIPEETARKLLRALEESI